VFAKLISMFGLLERIEQTEMFEYEDLLEHPIRPH
jgi:hypothetical protein